MTATEDPLDLLQILATIETEADEPPTVSKEQSAPRDTDWERETLLQIYHQAREAMDGHGLPDWRLKFDKAVKRAGVTRYGRKAIGLSAPRMLRFVAEGAEHQVRETILHEIAHALVGHHHHHDDVWKAAARRIGSTGERCVDPDAPRIEGDLVGTCPAGHTTTRHRRPDGVRSCDRCSKTFDERYLLTWTFQGQPLADVGDVVRIDSTGTWGGRKGTVVKVGQTRYEVDVPGRGAVMVPFAMAQTVKGSSSETSRASRIGDAWLGPDEPADRGRG